MAAAKETAAAKKTVEAKDERAAATAKKGTVAAARKGTAAAGKMRNQRTRVHFVYYAYILHVHAQLNY